MIETCLSEWDKQLRNLVLYPVPVKLERLSITIMVGDFKVVDDDKGGLPSQFTHQLLTLFDQPPSLHQCAHHTSDGTIAQFFTCKSFLRRGSAVLVHSPSQFAFTLTLAVASGLIWMAELTAITSKTGNDAGNQHEQARPT